MSEGIDRSVCPYTLDCGPCLLCPKSKKPLECGHVCEQMHKDKQARGREPNGRLQRPKKTKEKQ